MLTELKFVQGSAAKKDLVPALTHFVIENGTVRGYNGTLALCSPIPFDIACKPKAEPLIKAIASCADVVQLSMTPAGRLRVHSGAFKAFIDCIEGETPHVLPTGERVEVDGTVLLAGIKAVQPFIGEDASRPWVNGVLLRGPSIFATNNVCLVEFWAGATVPVPTNVPSSAVKELLRINEPPTHVQYDDNSITFHYEGDRWLRTQLRPADWPDLSKILDQPCNPLPIDPKLFEGLAVLAPFTDHKLGRIFIRDGVMSTHSAGSEEGATYVLDDFPHFGVYNATMLGLLQGAATKADFSTYPKPCLFYGDNLRGAIIGMRE